MSARAVGVASIARHRFEEKKSSITFLQVGLDRIAKTAECLGFTATHLKSISDDFSMLLGPGGNLPTGGGWHHSLVANDGMPHEISVAWSPRDTQLRFLVEPLSESGLPGDDTCARILSQLSSRPGVSLARYGQIADIFTPGGERVPFSVWFSGAYGKKTDPVYKVYLNPGASADESWINVAEALRILGLEDEWEQVRRRYARTECHPAYFSLDLSATPASRVKVYMKHGNRSGLKGVRELGPEYRSLAAACSGLAKGWGTRRKPVQTCISFSPANSKVSGVTLYYPLSPNLPCDAVATPRVAQLLRAERLDSAGYLSVVDALAVGPADGSSVQSWLGVKRATGGMTVTVYFGPETYRLRDWRVSAPGGVH